MPHRFRPLTFADAMLLMLIGFAITGHISWWVALACAVFLFCLGVVLAVLDVLRQRAEADEEPEPTEQEEAAPTIILTEKRPPRVYH